GKFREDLFHRLDLYRIQIPPLRDRGDDVTRLAELLLETLCRRHRVAAKRLTAAGQRRLLAYPWPGNVRELAHELERAIVFEEGDSLNFEHLMGHIRTSSHGGQKAGDWFNDSYAFPAEGFDLEEAINRLLQKALRQSGNNVSAAARLLG